MNRLAIFASSIGVATLLSSALAQERTSPVMTQQEIADLLAKWKQSPPAKPTPLCALLQSPADCRLFAVPDALKPLPGAADRTLPGLGQQPFKPAVPTLSREAPAAITVACPQDDHFHTCRVISDLTNVGPGQAGVTLYLGGSRSAELSKRAAEGLLTSGEVKGLLSEKTIGLLPKAVEMSAADRAVGALANSAVAKTGRGAAVVGVALMTYAAYQYFFGKDDKDEKARDQTAPAK